MTYEQKLRLLKFARNLACSALLLTPDSVEQLADISLADISLEDASEWLFSNEIVILDGSIIAPDEQEAR